MSISQISISGSTLSWDGPSTLSYNVIGIDQNNIPHIYYTGLTTKVATIYSPVIQNVTSYIKSFVIQSISGGITISGSYTYCLGSISINSFGEVIGVSSIDQSFNIIIPSIYNGIPVVSLKTDAFNGQSNLIKVDFVYPTLLSSIGQNTFKDCTNLKNITLPDSITSIGNSAFINSGLIHVNLPQKLQYIGHSAFNYTSLSTVTIPINVTTIGPYAFNLCSNLANVNFSQPSSLTTIGESAFDNNPSLISIVLPSSVTTIDNYAFTSTLQFFFEGDVPAPSSGVVEDIITFGNDSGDASGYFYSFNTNWNAYLTTGYRGITMYAIPSIPPPVLITTSPTIIDVSSVMLLISGDATKIYYVYNNDVFYASGEISVSNTASLMIRNLTDGLHTFKASLTDLNSITSPYTYMRPILVDTYAPPAPILSTTTGSYSVSSSIIFNIVGESSAVYSLYTNSAFTLSGVLDIFGSATISISNLSDMAYVFKVRLTDLAGNIGNFSNNLSIQVITIPPNAPTLYPIPSKSSETITISGAVNSTYFISMTDSVSVSGTMTSSGIPYSYINLLYTNSYLLSVYLKDVAGNTSPVTSIAWTPPFTLSISGMNLLWNGRGSTTYTIYSVRTDGSMNSIGTSYYPTYSLVQYSGLTMSFYVSDPSMNYGQINNVVIPTSIVVDNSVNASTYVKEALYSNTTGRTLRNTLSTYATYFSTSILTLSGIDCSKLIDPSQSNMYTQSSYANRPFTIVLCPSGGSCVVQSANLSIDTSSILYLAITPNSSVTYIIDNTPLSVMCLSSSVIIGGTTYALGSVFPFGKNNYKLTGFSSIIAEPYLVPQSLVITDNVLSWTGNVANTSYRVYNASGNTIAGTTTTTTFVVPSAFATYYVVGVAGTSVSSPSQTITYLIPPMAFSFSGTVVRWNYYDISGFTYNLYAGSSLVTTTSSLTYDVSGRPAGTYVFTFTARFNGTTSSLSNPITIVIASIPIPTPPPVIPIIVPCFLANAPVLTPTGYTQISKLTVGDNVQTADGRIVKIQQALKRTVAASPFTNPYIIPKGKYGAIRNLEISPNHRVVIEDGSMVEARFLGLKQQERDSEEILDYYNLELPDWKNDNMIVAGVAVESLAPVRRTIMSMEEFKARLVATYGRVTPSILAKIERTCRILPDGRVDCPIIQNRK